MELTREEAIKRHREMWKWLAENPMKDKKDYLDIVGQDPFKHCYLCELTHQKCSKCLVEWPKTHKARSFFSEGVPCMASYFDDWEKATAPEERSRLAALIRDLPEKQEAPKPATKYKPGDKVRVREGLKEDSRYGGVYFNEDMVKSCGKAFTVKEVTINGHYNLDESCWRWSEEMLEPAPKYSVGDKVVPVSKTAKAPEGCTYSLCSPEKDPIWLRRKAECGYLTIERITGDNYTRANGQYVYDCGNFYCESDLIPYVEPVPEKITPRAFQVGDRVQIHPKLPETTSLYDFCEAMRKYAGEVTIIKDIWDNEYAPGEKGYALNGIGWSWYEDAFSFYPINLCPEPKTITENSATFIFHDNVTECIMEIEGCKFKGVAKCAPEDTWDEETGKGWAKLRALRKFCNAVEKELRSK